MEFWQYIIKLSLYIKDDKTITITKYFVHELIQFTLLDCFVCKKIKLGYKNNHQNPIWSWFKQKKNHINKKEIVTMNYCLKLQHFVQEFIPLKKKIG